MTLKGTTPGTFWVVWLIFLQLRYQIISYARDFLLIKFFLISFKNFLLQLIAPWTNELTRVICARHKWGMFGPLYPLNKHGDLYFLIVFFETGISRKLLKEVFKKKIALFLRNHLERNKTILSEDGRSWEAVITRKLNVFLKTFLWEFDSQPTTQSLIVRIFHRKWKKKGLLISLALNSNQVRRSCVNWKIWKMKKNANLTWPTQH